MVEERSSYARKGVASHVIQDVADILHSKTTAQLDGLEKGILQKLKHREGIDVDYWNYLLDSVRRKSSSLRLCAMLNTINLAAEERNNAMSHSAPELELASSKSSDALISVSSSLPKQAQGTTEKDFESATMKLYKQEANHDLEQDEELFNTESELAEVAPKWKKQYPEVTERKPKFFNRVQTGYEWNAYNKIHFDEANPPPKIVTGYRFNVFYPDLLDPLKAPSYKIENKGRKVSTGGIEQDSCILRFFAGAPYSDVTFEVIDKEWDHSSRYDRGFKSSFDKGILQLHFKFKRIMYSK